MHFKSFSVAAKSFSFLLLVLLVCGLFTCFSVGGVSAQVGVIDSVPIGSSSTATWPFLGTGNYVSFGQGFVGNGFFVTGAEFVLYRQGLSSVDVWVVAEIYGSNGAAFGSDLPVGSALAVSEPLLLNNIVSTSAGVSSFVFDGGFQVLSGVSYFVVVSVVGGDLGGASLYMRSTGVGLNGGVFVGFTGSGWVGVYASHGLMFVLYGEPDASDVGGGDGLVSSDWLLLVLFFVLTCLVWVFAVVRQSLGLCLLSSVCWFGFAFVLYLTAGATADAAGAGNGGLVAGFALLSVLLGVVMVVLSLYAALRVMRLGVEKREMDEGVF
jgi:hypothetical protein